MHAGHTFKNKSMHSYWYRSYIPYSDKFSRSKIFAVFADFARTVKIIPSKILHPRNFYTTSLGSCKVFMKRIMALFRYFSSVDKPAKPGDKKWGALE